MACTFTLVKDTNALLSLFEPIQALADSEKVALGFLPKQALHEAIERGRLFALTANNGSGQEIAGYLLYSGVFPHAKIQQIAVANQYRKQAVGSSLIRSFVSDLEQLGFMSIKAEIASDLDGPLAFYRKNGFEFVCERDGGQTRNRKILVHVRQLETDTLFSASDVKRSRGLDLGIKRRSAGEAPFYAFDLNVYFDLAKNREKSEIANQLFGAALAHNIRLVVASEFVKELKRTTNNAGTDAILKLAQRLPGMPAADKAELDTLASQVHDLVFVQPQRSGANSDQAISDARHLAHAALGRASAFITGDKAILAARNQLLSTIGIDVVTVSELVDLLPKDPLPDASQTTIGQGFTCGTITGLELDAYLRDSRVNTSLISEFCSVNETRNNAQYLAIRESGRVVAVGAILLPRTVTPIARLLVHVRPEHHNVEIFTDYLLDTLVRVSCTDTATAIELVHMLGQSPVHSLAKARGFYQNSSTRNYDKIALGHPLTQNNWQQTTHEVRRRTGFALPNNPPSGGNDSVNIATGTSNSIVVTPSELEDILSPAVIIWPRRISALVPIRRIYADDLLGTSKQQSFDFITNKDASFFSRRSFVNSPRTASVMRPECPIFFYESQTGNGRGAVVAVARIVNAIVVQKQDIPDERLRRLVVYDVDEFSATDEVLLTSFDNLFELPRTIPLKELRCLGVVDGANLVSPVNISSEQAATILTKGWPNE